MAAEGTQDIAATPAAAAPAEGQTQLSQPSQTTDTTAPQQTSEQPAIPAPAAPVEKAPDKYDLKLPQDTLLDDASIKLIEDVARKNNMSNEKAQALIEEQSKQYAQQVESWKSSWEKATRNDPEIGGNKFDESINFARRAIEKFDPDGKLKAELNRLGYGNHPEMVRAWAKVGRALADSEFTGSANSGGSGAPKSIAEQLYGGTTK